MSQSEITQTGQCRQDIAVRIVQTGWWRHDNAEKVQKE